MDAKSQVLLRSCFLALFLMLSIGGIPVMAGAHAGLDGNSVVSDTGRSHPRLFVDQPRLERLRAAIERPGTHHYEAFRAMKERVERADWRVYDSDPDDGNWNYARSHLAREASLAYLLTEKRRYAQIAYDALRAIHQNPDPDGRIPEENYGLSRAMTGMGFAIAYDWAYHGLSPDQREYVREKIKIALDAWPSYHHANLKTDHMGSNWVAVCRGGELVMMLAVYEEDDRAVRYRKLKNWLLQHIETAYGPSGWSQEGIGYIRYASQFLLPAIYAAQSVGDTAFDDQLGSIAWHRLQMAVGAFTPERHHLMSGVDNTSGTDDQGWTSLLLNAVPEAHRPYYTSFYDHHMGVHAVNPPAEKYDHKRAGTTWALLYYPIESNSKTPTQGLSRSLFDEEKGMYYFRDQWTNASDILVSMAGDYTHHGHAWDVREGFQLGIVAHGTLYAGGPGKEREHRGFSSLLVDGRAFPEDGGHTGAPVSADADSSGGGYVIVDGGAKYRSLGVETARRHLMVRYPEDGPDAVLSTLDRVQADSSHTYTWQLNHDDQGEDPEARPVETPRSSTFVLRGNNDSYLKGWVLRPSDTTVETGAPIRIRTEGRRAELWVVMAIGTGDPPAGHVSGTGADAGLQIGSKQVEYDDRASRIRLRRGQSDP